MSGISAEAAAARLGVKVATVYAYVSRGELHSWQRPGSRASLFDADEVEALARRGRPRRASQPPALDFVIETRLTAIGDHDIFYRGRTALGLARTAAFEDVAEWLWTGEWAGSPPAWRATPLSLPDLPFGRDRLRLAVVLASAGDPLRADLATGAVVNRARTLIATMVEAVPGNGEGRGARLQVEDGQGPRRGTVAGQLFGRLAGVRPTPGLVAALNAALVLLADHELAASTLAARVAASARADPYAVVLAGLGPLSGPLHGAASLPAYRMVEEAVAAGPDRALALALETQQHIPGFGHSLYPGGDPRARLLMELLRSAAPGSPTLVAVDRLVSTARRRAEREPNVDLALAALASVARMPEDAGEIIFTLARTAGWIAHAIEEYGEQPLRFRPRAVARSQPAGGPSDGH